MILKLSRQMYIRERERESEREGERKRGGERERERERYGTVCFDELRNAFCRK